VIALLLPIGVRLKQQSLLIGCVGDGGEARVRRGGFLLWRDR
jgi:hypothetical protein